MVILSILFIIENLIFIGLVIYFKFRPITKEELRKFYGGSYHFIKDWI